MSHAPSTDPFETLGIDPAFELDLGAVERRYRDLSRVLHPDRHVGAPSAERRMALSRAVEVNEAWRVVRDPIRRAEALLRRAGVAVEEGREPKPSPALLMDVMEQREALAEARVRGDVARVEALAGAMRARETKTLAALGSGFSEPDKARDLVPLVGELRYFRRFLDEVSAVEEELTERAHAAAGDAKG